MSFITQTSLPSEERVVLASIECASDTLVGDWVRYDNTNILVKARADNILTSRVIGLVEEKTSLTTANVLVMGISKEIFTGLDRMQYYFLSVDSPGEMYLPPISLQSNSVILSLGVPATSNKFIVRIQHPIKRS